MSTCSYLIALLCGLQCVAAAPTCCWSKWGDASSCGGYSGSGGRCNTDPTKSCNSNSDCPDSPVPAPTPAPPTPPPAPTPPTPPGPPSPSPAEVIGYWSETWSNTSAPPGANIGIAFSGWNDPDKAQAESKPLHDTLVGDKWIDAGGGNQNGRWNADWLSKWESTIKSGGLKDWKGIVFDIEECYASGLADAFSSAFRTAKSAGLGVLVTVSHSGPYGCSDSHDLMQSFFSNQDIDYLSPQLYTSGNEAMPDFDAGNGVKWTDWAGSKARFVPSLACNSVKSGGYTQTKAFFAKYNISTTGYIVWPSRGCSLFSGGEVMV